MSFIQARRKPQLRPVTGTWWQS